MLAKVACEFPNAKPRLEGRKLGDTAAVTKRAANALRNHGHAVDEALLPYLSPLS
jgi:hypothetical protein